MTECGSRGNARESRVSESYYLSRKRKLMKSLKKDEGVIRSFLIEEYGPEFSDAALREAEVEFESLIPKIPYIGGSGNLMTSDLVESVKLLAFYRVMKARGVPPDKTFRIVHRAMKARFERYPRVLRKLIGRLQMSRFFVKRLKRLAAESQERRFPGNFVFTVVIGDGGWFDWGLDFTECAILKFFRSENAEEFMPYICPNDYATGEAFDLGLVRTKTLAEGMGVCDQRLKRGRKTETRFPDGGRVLRRS